MRSAALALTWQTWGRHRWGFGALVVFLLALCSLYHFVPSTMLISEAGAVLLAIPLALTFVYIFYIFSYVEIGLRGKPSGFPAWMFTLPVRTGMLVLWPMLYGAVTIAVAWIVVARFILKPGGLDVPLWWPALGLAATLTWAQAVEWSSLAGLTKGILAGVVLAGVWIGLLNEAAHDLTVLLLPAFYAVAYGAAMAGVSRVRRGKHMPGLGWQSALARTGSWLPRRQTPFASAERAQLWLECRRNATLLPFVVGCWLLLMALYLLLMGEEGHAPIHLFNLIAFVPFIAPLVGCLLGKPDVWLRPFRLPAHASTRPMTSGSLVVAKLQMAALSLLATWLLLGAGTLLLAYWLGHRGTIAMMIDSLQQTMRPRPGPRLRFLGIVEYNAEGSLPWVHPAYVLLPLGLVALFGFSWLQLSGNLFAGLAGRLWVFGATFFIYLAAVPNLLVMQSTLDEQRSVHQFLSEALPWMLRLAVLAKFAIAVWAFRRTIRRGLLRSGVAWLLGALWCLIALSCLASMLVLTGSGTEIDVEYLAVRVVLALPLVRLAAAPLVLEWNRHR